MKCIVIATKNQLESIGCCRDLTNKEVEYIKDYHTGYTKIIADAPDYVKEILGDKAQKETYDIPKKWLEFIN